MAIDRTKNIIYGSSDWRDHQYERMKEENRGHNYTYWTESLDKNLETKGYKWHKFNDGFDRNATSSELYAKEIVEEYRKTGHYARIIAGKSQNVQKTKMFSVTYKLKNTNEISK